MQLLINYISFNTSVGRIKFQNGTMMKSTTEAKYLCAVMNDNDKADLSQEIRRWILSTMPILKRLDIFWNKTNCGKSWKWLVYNSIIISRLLHGLESLQTTDNTGKLLNIFQLKGLNLHTTYIDRNNSNEFVYQRANEVVGAPSQGPLRKIRPLTEMLESKRLKILGHVLRRPWSYPQHQVTFSFLFSLTKNPIQSKSRQTQKNWTIENMKLAWNILKANDDGLPNLNFDHRTLVIREALVDAARAYNPLSTDYRFWCDRTRFERYSVWTNSMWNVCNRTRFEHYSVWTNSMWNVCAWCARHGIQ